jgi:hypothetical protein
VAAAAALPLAVAFLSDALQPEEQRFLMSATRKRIRDWLRDLDSPMVGSTFEIGWLGACIFDTHIGLGVLFCSDEDPAEHVSISTRTEESKPECDSGEEMLCRCRC